MMGDFRSLPDATLDDLVAAVQASASGDSTAMAEILRRFDKKMKRIASSMTSDSHLQDDAAQGARIGLLSAVRNHKPGTAGFASYAVRHMRGEARRALSKMLGSPKETSTETAALDQVADASIGKAPRGSRFEVVDLIFNLSPEQQAITLAYYVDDAPLSDIAFDLGISTSAVSQRINTIHRALRPVAEQVLAA